MNLSGISLTSFRYQFDTFLMFDNFHFVRFVCVLTFFAFWINLSLLRPYRDICWVRMGSGKFFIRVRVPQFLRKGKYIPRIEIIYFFCRALVKHFGLNPISTKKYIISNLSI